MSIAGPLRRLDSLLKSTGHALQSWSQTQVENVRQQIGLAKELIGQFDVAEEKRLLTPAERWFRNELKKKMLSLCTFERTMVRQRLREGDANTHFSHLHANHCQRRYYITQLKVEGSWIQSQAEISKAFATFYENLTGKPVVRSHTGF